MALKRGLIFPGSQPVNLTIDLRDLNSNQIVLWPIEHLSQTSPPELQRRYVEVKADINTQSSIRDFGL